MLNTLIMYVPLGTHHSCLFKNDLVYSDNLLFYMANYPLVFVFEFELNHVKNWNIKQSVMSMSSEIRNSIILHWHLQLMNILVEFSIEIARMDDIFCCPALVYWCSWALSLNIICHWLSCYKKQPPNLPVVYYGISQAL